jgi:glycosyltransferase involved in cell wall biosynthesis
MNDQTRLPISVCLIAGNEASRIRRTLDSVAGWTSEIIVVLNEEVADGTDKIAEAAGVKVFREPWKGFTAQKNSAADKCTQPWLLNLDADEEVTPELRAEIQYVTAGPGAAAAYSFPRLTQFCGRWIRHGDWYPDRQTRLWRRRQARWVGGQVHERLEVDGLVGKLNARLLHHLGDSIDRQIAKISTYSEGLAQDALARGKTSSTGAILFRSAWRFFRSYLLRLGFLDGWQGAYIAWMTAFYTATRYAKVCAAQKK